MLLYKKTIRITNSNTFILNNDQEIFDKLLNSSIILKTRSIIEYFGYQEV